MNVGDAEEYTQALGQVAAGAWRQVALGERLGVPTALGLTTREWVEQRLGGYVRLAIPERREAVAELVAEGMTQREVADVLGVANGTVAADIAQNRAADEDVPAPEREDDSEPAQNRADASADERTAAERVRLAGLEGTIERGLDVLAELELVETDDDRLASQERDARVLALVSKAIAGAGPVTTALPAAESMLTRVDRDRLLALAPRLESAAATFAALAECARQLQQNRPRLVRGGRQ
jgi:predicted transcriptional regulator